MAKSLLNVTWKNGTPSLEKVREKFGFLPGELDSEFGVIEIDPEDDLFCVLVEQEAIRRVQGQLDDPDSGINGPFSNPPIGPFGPPKAS